MAYALFARRLAELTQLGSGSSSASSAASSQKEPVVHVVFVDKDMEIPSQGLVGNGDTVIANIRNHEIHEHLPLSEIYMNSAKAMEADGLKEMLFQVSEALLSKLKQLSEEDLRHYVPEPQEYLAHLADRNRSLSDKEKDLKDLNIHIIKHKIVPPAKMKEIIEHYTKNKKH